MHLRKTFKKSRNKAFFMIAANVQSRLNKIWPKLRINCKALATALKKNSRLFTIIPDFFQIEKIAGQVSRLFQEFQTLYKPWKHIKASKYLTCYASCHEAGNCTCNQCTYSNTSHVGFSWWRKWPQATKLDSDGGEVGKTT